MALAVELQILYEAGDGEYARELHDPPDEYLHGQQRVARPRAHEREDEDGLREIGVEHVRAGHVLVVAAWAGR